MHGIRILLIGMPAILREVIRSIVAEQPDMEIVAELPEGAPVSAVRDVDAAFVTVGLDRFDELPEIGTRLLTERPSLRVLGLSAEGRHGYLYELRPHRVPIGEISPERLVNVIRAAVPSS